MVAICSDIDHTRIDTFRETHRFMNTLAQTSMGQGVGLDIANSLWLYKSPSHNPTRENLSYFSGLSWDEPSPYADELLEYARSGWIDTLHTYGNFGLTPGIEVRFARDHAVHALDMLRRAGIALTVWVNHGDANNRQNIGDFDSAQGDRPEAPEYHTDLLRHYGTEFLWLRGRTDQLGGPSLIEEHPLNDGGHMFGFRRFQSLRNPDGAQRIAHAFGLNCFSAYGGDLLLQVWTPQGLKYQLSEEVLDSLVRNGHLCVLGQHLGSLTPMTSFDREMIAAFRRLRRFQDEGSILVARTSRLLQYNRVRDNLVFSCVAVDGRLVIDIEAVVDPVRGRWVPAIDDLRGISFDTGPSRTIELRLAGNRIDSAEIATASTEGGGSAIGIRWFGPDLTDRAAEFLRTERTSYVLWSPSVREEVDRENARIIELLQAERETSPATVEPERYTAAVNYSLRRYQVGLLHYTALLERIGFTEMGRALDVGSGAGHWCIAFLRHGERAVGIDRYPEYVEIATRTAKSLRLDKRVRFLIGLAEDVQLVDGSFNCAWSHSVLMFANVERVIGKVSRSLATGGGFYCGYTTEGDRLSGIQAGLATREGSRLSAQISILLNGYLNLCGVFNTSDRIRILTLDDLLRVCRTFGLEYVGQPGIQDGREDYLGIPVTFDFLVRKTAASDKARSKLLAGESLETNWLDDLEQIARSGCPGLVCDVLRSVDPELADEEWLQVYARALIRADRAAGDEARGVFDGSRQLPDRIMGLYWHDRRKYADALACYQRMDEADPDKAFLVGSCLLAGNEFECAQRHFHQAIDDGWHRRREWIGLVAAHHGAGDREAAIRAFRGLIESRREAGVAENIVAAEIARLEQGR
jgi:SAM-dependent methyltransferase